MGQKAHPISIRLNNFLNWQTEWYSKNNLISSKLVYQTYFFRSSLIYFFYKNKIFVHSLKLTYINNSIYLTFFCLPFYDYWLELKQQVQKNSNESYYKLKFKERKKTKKKRIIGKQKIKKFSNKYLEKPSFGNKFFNNLKLSKTEENLNFLKKKYKFFLNKQYRKKKHKLYYILKLVNNVLKKKKLVNDRKNKLQKLLKTTTYVSNNAFNFTIKQLKTQLHLLISKSKRLSAQLLKKKAVKKSKKFSSLILKKKAVKKSKKFSSLILKKKAVKKSKQFSSLILKKKSIKNLTFFKKILKKKVDFYFLNKVNDAIFVDKINQEFLMYLKLKKIYFFREINYIKSFNFCKLKNLSLSLSNFTLLSNVILHLRDLSKFVKLSQKIIKTSRFLLTLLPIETNQWSYYFKIMSHTSPSSLLICLFLKSLLEKKRLKKKQKFILIMFKQFLNENTHFLKKFKGFKIHVKGRLNGRNRSTIYKHQFGPVSLQNFSKKIDYCFWPAFTIYGVFGIKVWIVY